MTQKLDFLSIGYLSRTKIISDGVESNYMGGPSLNVARVLSKLGHNVGLISPFGPEITEEEIDYVRELGIDVSGLWGTDRTFQLVIDKNNPPPLIISVSDSITSDRVPLVYRIIPNVYLGPVISEIPNETLLFLFEQMADSNFFLDVQGYTRRFQGRMMPDEILKWSDRHEVIDKLDVIKLNEREMGLVMGSDEPEAMRELGSEMKNGGILIVTRGENGSSIYRDGIVTNIEPVVPERIVDTTCAGDSYMGAFISEYCKHDDPIRAGFTSRII